jgi:peptidoglycan/xylan/chitin deacetylase (PgdA/CDA1 family)
MVQAALIDQVKTDHKVVAFTFDDGPNPIYTPQVLDIFKEVSGRATFYMIGEHMLKYPHIVTAVVEQQHEIGNHTFSHPFLTQLSAEECLKELKQSDDLIGEMTGSKPATFRPPYIDYNDETEAVVDLFGYSAISALNMDATDWEQPGIDHIVTKTRNHIRNGSILLFHDGYKNRSQTIEAVRVLVKELSAQGYRFVTVSELLGLSDASVKEVHT